MSLGCPKSLSWGLFLLTIIMSSAFVGPWKGVKKASGLTCKVPLFPPNYSIEMSMFLEVQIKEVIIHVFSMLIHSFFKGFFNFIVKSDPWKGGEPQRRILTPHEKNLILIMFTCQFTVEGFQYLGKADESIVYTFLWTEHGHEGSSLAPGPPAALAPW